MKVRYQVGNPADFVERWVDLGRVVEATYIEASHVPANLTLVFDYGGPRKVLSGMIAQRVYALLSEGALEV